MIKPGISADSHIVEPGNCYIDYIDPKYRDIAPRVEKNEHGIDRYVINDMEGGVPIGILAGAGVPTDKLRAQRRKNFDEINPAAWNPIPRLAIQDEDHIAAELIYSSVGMVLCSHQDYAYKTACFHAYNRWLQEFCGQAPTRYFGLAQTSVESIDQTLKDFQMAKEMGMVGVMMTGRPQHEDYDHPDYDPIWECSIDLNLPICFHILTGDDFHSRDIFKSVRGHAANGFMNLVRGVQDVMGVFLFGGVFERFPQLKMVVAEGDAGWVPHYMYRSDHAAERLSTGTDHLSKLPSEYILNNIWFTFQDDKTAYDTDVMVNSGHLIWANDYPHTDSTYPNSMAILDSQMGHLTEDQRNAICHDNIKKVFDLPGVA